MLVPLYNTIYYNWARVDKSGIIFLTNFWALVELLDAVAVCPFGGSFVWCGSNWPFTENAMPSNGIEKVCSLSANGSLWLPFYWHGWTNVWEDKNTQKLPHGLMMDSKNHLIMSTKNYIWCTSTLNYITFLHSNAEV